MSNNTVGSAVAVVSATAEQFGADMTKIEGYVQSLKSTVEGSTPHGGIFESFAEGAGIGAGIELVKGAIEKLEGAVESVFQALDHVTEMDHFAESVGATANEINQLHFAASQFSVSAEQMDNALLKMEANIGKAREGSEKASAVFKRLGINVNDLAAMSGGDAFEAIAQAISQIPDPADRAAAAVEIFGKAGARLLPLLNQGSQGIEDMKSRAEELGIVLGQDQVEAMAAAERSVKQLGFAWDAFKNDLVGAVAPAIKAIMDDISFSIGLIHDFVTATEMLLGLHGEAQGKGEHRTAGGAGEAAGEAKRQAKEAKEVFKEIQKAAEAIVKEQQHAIDAVMKKGVDITKQMRNPMEVYQDRIAELSSLVNQGAISWETYERAVNAANAALAKTNAPKDLEKTQAVGATLAGTTAGFSAVQEALRNQKDDRANQDELAQQQLDQQKIMADALNQIQTNTAQLGGPAPVADFF